MRTELHIDIDAAKILQKRGLGESDAAQILLAETVARMSDPYVPFRPGSGVHLKSDYTVAPDGSELTYHGPYAHFQHEGELMVGVETRSAYAKSGEPKVGTGQPLTYSGGGLRGKEWVKRAMTDRGKEVATAIAKYVKGKVK